MNKIENKVTRVKGFYAARAPRIVLLGASSSLSSFMRFSCVPVIILSALFSTFSVLATLLVRHLNNTSGPGLCREANAENYLHTHTHSHTCAHPSTPNPSKDRGDGVFRV